MVWVHANLIYAVHKASMFNTGLLLFDSSRIDGSTDYGTMDYGSIDYRSTDYESTD